MQVASYRILLPNTAHPGSKNVVSIHWWITEKHHIFPIKMAMWTCRNKHVLCVCLPLTVTSSIAGHSVIPMSSIPHWANLFLRALGGYRPSLLQRCPRMLITCLLHDYHVVITWLSHGYHGSRSDKMLTNAQNRGWLSHDHLSSKLATGYLQKVKPCEGGKPNSHPQYCHGWWKSSPNVSLVLGFTSLFHSSNWPSDLFCR